MKLKLPQKINSSEDKTEDFEFGVPIVLLGANGAGKTRFSVKLEELNDPAFNSNQIENSHIHRLSAQKSLTIYPSISIYDLESSEKKLFLGDSENYSNKINSRFQNNPVTSLLNDYQQVLSLLFSENLIELEREHEKAQKCNNEGKQPPAPTETLVDRAQRIWNTLLPHRTIDLSGNGVHVNFNGQKYHGKEMSDGERVMLYMICQALVVKPKSLFIIDEPELHIHKAIVKELWTQLENERPDCIFMYLTHDLDFALSRNNARFLWIKSYNGISWDYDFLDIHNYPDLPGNLLLEIIGTRQNIVFVEGAKGSYDYQLFQELYRDKKYHVIPCGGCDEIIRLMKDKDKIEKLQPIKVYGIIDRDFRCDREINALMEDGIFFLKVAEVENLFVVPEVLDIMEQQLGCKTGTADDAKDFIKELYEKLKKQQITEALSREISFQLFDFKLGNESYTNEEINEKIVNRFTTKNIGSWRTEKETIFNSADTLENILAVFNFKGLSHKIGKSFGLSDQNFPQRVINVLKNNKAVRKELLTAFYKYVPKLP